VLARAEDFSNGLLYRGSVRSHSRAGIGLGNTTKYSLCTTAQRPEQRATRNERRRGQRTWYLDQVSATHNERRREQRPKPMPGITYVPLVRASVANKQNSTAGGWGKDTQCLRVEPELATCVH
jgi:hypothetical protein